MIANSSGSITLNGITDKELGKIWEIKARNEKAFIFQPNMMQPGGSPQGEQFYTNVHFQWTGEAGLKIVEEVLAFILKKEGAGPVAVAG
jgi:hypothetical protein